MEETKKPKRVQAPKGCSEHLTPGKIYDVIGCWDEFENGFGHAFAIKDDEGGKLLCLEKGCGHLNGKNWIIIETE